MRNLYTEIRNRLENIDFNSLWPGFSICPFALYNDEKVYFDTYEIEKTDQFLGNTSILYDGQQIAIWKIDEADTNDLDLLTVSIIHEMYHSYQLKSGDNRFYSDIKALSYPIDFENMNVKLNESMLLANAIKCTDTAQKAESFKKFLTLRKQRYHYIGEGSAYEKSIETIEGSAEFVALTALRTINQDLYKEAIDNAIEWITIPTEKLLDIRRVSYYIGSLVCILADELKIKYKMHLRPGLECNLDAIIDSFEFAQESNSDIVSNEIIKTLILKRDEYLKNKVYEFLTQENIEVFHGNFLVKGYDPMNMLRYNNYVYHKHFLGINNGVQTDFVMGEILVETDGHDFGKFTTYYKIKQ